MSVDYETSAGANTGRAEIIKNKKGPQFAGFFIVWCLAVRRFRAVFVGEDFGFLFALRISGAVL